VHETGVNPGQTNGLLRAVRVFACCVVLGCAALASEPLPARTVAEIDAIELVGRGDPLKALSKVEALLAHVGPNDPVEPLLQELHGFYLPYAQRTTEALQLANQLEKRGRPNERTSADLIRGNAAWINGDIPQAQHYLERAFAEMQPDAPVSQRYHVIMVRASVMARQGKLKDALEQYMHMVDELERVDSPFRLMRVHDAIANLLSSIGEQDKALAHSDLALQQAEALGDTSTLSILWTTRASIFALKNMPEDEHKATNEAIEYARESGSPTLIADSLTNLSDIDLKAHHYAEAIHNAEMAIEMCKTQLKVDPSCSAIAEDNEGEARILSGDIARGKALVEHGLSLIEKTGDSSSLIDPLIEYGAILEQVGDYKTAVAVYHRERKLSQEFDANARKKAMLELDTRFQTERKERQIALLNRENALKASELKNQKLQVWVWLLGACLLTLGLIAIGLLYRRAHKANQKLLASNAMLKVTSERDALTGLYNRRYFQTAIRALMEQDTLRCGLLLFDIDHFKRINDTMGHTAGDAVIVEVARRIQEATRGSDFVVRWGGEEFLAVVGSMPREQLDRLAERLLTAIASTPITYGSQGISITASIGYAEFPLSESHYWIDWERAVNLVDMALYSAKADGRNRACGIAYVAPGGAEVFDMIEADFHKACQDGRVKLTVFEGPSA